MGGGGAQGDPRTPLAWQQRQQRHQQAYALPPPDRRGRSESRSVAPRRSRSSSSSSSSSSETSVSVDRPAYERNGARLSPHHEGTLRSSRSVTGIPQLQTWDGEPCPVHGAPMPPPMGPPMLPMPGPPPHHMSQAMRRAASAYDLPNGGGQFMLPPPMPPHGPMMHPGYRTLPMLGPPPGPPMPMDIYGTIPPPNFLPPMMRPRPVVMPAEGRAPPEPLPMRDPDKSKSGTTPIPPSLPHKLSPSIIDTQKKKKKKISCCGGWMLVLWIIIGVIVFCVALGIVLRLVIP